MTQAQVVASSIFFVGMVLVVALGVLSGRKRERSLKEWSVSSRSFGFMFVLIFMAGESYTSFSFLGTAGWSYEYGIPILYLVGYLSSGMVVAYFVAPLIWSYAAKHGLICISDIAAFRFRSKAVGVLVAVLATLFLIPYVQLEIQGMAVAVNAVTYGGIDLTLAAVVSFVVAQSFVVTSGLRGSAWVSAVKDALVVGSTVFLFIYIPLHFFGGFAEFAERMIVEKKQWLVFPGNNSPYGGLWFASTIVLNCITINVFPTTVSGFMSAKSPNMLRRNSIVLPWYQLLLIMPMMLGAMALFILPSLGNSNLVMFHLIIDALPPAAVAIIGVAAALSSIVPISVFTLVIGTMWGSTIAGRFDPGAEHKTDESGRRQSAVARTVCFAAGFIALGGALFMPSLLVNLSVFSYEGMAQLVPMVLLGLYWRNMTRTAGIAGLVLGAAVVLLLHATGNDPYHGVNGGLVALAVNVCVVVVVSKLWPDRPGQPLISQGLEQAPARKQ